jgi:hypothetical protein
MSESAREHSAVTALNRSMLRMSSGFVSKAPPSLLDAEPHIVRLHDRARELRRDGHPTQTSAAL